ncbi:MAG: 50S ribosome-binding GTPase [Candidatus Diapherotrites archaeon]|nr:50S ribosome-binding GTPase [Candidatus Diapherotrites archaeon]
MPANLPPHYFEAEKRYRLAKTPQEKTAALEEMLAIMPKHKGTDKLRAELRHRMAKLAQAPDKKSAARRASMVIPKEGAAQVAVIGLPNSGKSQLVASITNTSPAVAQYPFTTQDVTPAMMAYENIQIQLLDTPPLSSQPLIWWLPPILRRADALLAVIDLSNEPASQMATITSQLENLRVETRQTKLLLVANKLDLDHNKKHYTALRNRYQGLLPTVAVSATTGDGLEDMKHKLYQVLDIIRIYTKTPGQKPDLNDPIILARGSTLAQAAASVHKDFAAGLKYARIWGSGKHDGIMAKRDHVMQDGDVIELHL